MERRSEKLAQAFMQYKEGELSKEAYIEMKDDRNNRHILFPQSR